MPAKHISVKGDTQLCLPLSGLVATEADLVAVALALGARDVAGWSSAEEALARSVKPVGKRIADDYCQRIRSGDDPLGVSFCELRSASERRQKGATYTPRPIVDAMVDWAADNATPASVIDPGAGSARYLLAIGRKLPATSLTGIEIDPLAAMLARANLAAVGLAGRSRIIVADYRETPLPATPGKTLFIGNPPYVRHHAIAHSWKQWFVREAARLGLSASQLAGLHIHFFLATAGKARHGDYGAFITASEWLDVNYGSLLRDLFLRELGGQQIVLIEPAAMPFPDATTTAAITYFEIGARPTSIRLKRANSLHQLVEPNGNHLVRRERLETQRRWSHLTRPARRGPAGYIELGELCRVHRGQVTGANKVWIAGAHSEGLPEGVLFASVTKARELFAAGRVLNDLQRLRRVIDLPADLDVFDPAERRLIDRFLEIAKVEGADQSYVALNRKAWWSVGLRKPAPILATYMARRPPAFVRNRAAARHINIAHGLYPRDKLNEKVLVNLVDYLSEATHLTDGRTYAGGLTKFEPREMERLLVPGMEMLVQGVR
jgi:adenine-specific DNA-methyltransferase